MGFHVVYGPLSNGWTAAKDRPRHEIVALCFVILRFNCDCSILRSLQLNLWLLLMDDAPNHQ